MIGCCLVCGREGTVHRHHIIHGRGKRKQQETPYSVIPLCPACHSQVHGKQGHALDTWLKQRLQALYFAEGYTEEEVRRLMGGKLVLKDGDVCRQ
nr:MAG TPA: HNH endonuclease, GmR87, NESG, Structural Genomics.6A [Caudoviricetes sp.]